MKTKRIKLRTVLLIVLVNLLIGSPIFAQVKTKTINATQQKKTNKVMRVENLEVRELNTIPCAVGDFVHGGIVFYVDETGRHGLACTNLNQIRASWSPGINKTGAIGEGLYDGKNNTALIINSVGDGGGTPYAAKICDDLIVTQGTKTYNDWYLPSKGELNIMYQNREKIIETANANGGHYFVNWYWSSTENNDESYFKLAWIQIFTEGGGQSLNDKPIIRYSRPVRRF